MIKIKKPTLFIAKERVFENIKTMAAKAEKSSVQFRPHFKTHQSVIVGEWFRSFGVRQITVSSIDMARYFANSGWKDITLAIVVNPLQIEDINSLMKNVSLNLLVDNEKTAIFLSRHLRKPTKVWLKIDCGYNRTGLHYNDIQRISDLAENISKSAKLNFAGILTHAGTSYNAGSVAELKNIYFDTVQKMVKIKENLLKKGLPEVKISYGDTPTCSVIDDFSDVDEIRPGNFVFFDLMQLQLNACLEDDIAASVACPVVGIYPEREEIVIYGGAIHLSKEYIQDKDNNKIYGYISRPDMPWTRSVPGSYISSLSQEHGVVKADSDFINSLQIGDIVFILPVHACLAANLFQSYLTTDGELINNIHTYQQTC